MPVPWNSGSYYKYNATTPSLSDVVQVGNVSYIAVADSVNQQPPSASWAITTSTSLTANNLVVSAILTSDNITTTNVINAAAGAFSVASTGALTNTFSTSTGSLTISTRGQFTANGTTEVAISVPTITATSCVLITYAGSTTSTYAVPYITKLNPGINFRVIATTGDVGIYNWTIIN